MGRLEETIVDFSGTKNWYTVKEKPLCYCIFRVLVEDKSWENEPTFYQLARQFIDEVLRRTDIHKLELDPFKEVVGCCRPMSLDSAGLTSFLRDAASIEAAGAEANQVQKSRAYQRRGDGQWRKYRSIDSAGNDLRLSKIQDLNLSDSRMVGFKRQIEVDEEDSPHSD